MTLLRPYLVACLFLVCGCTSADAVLLDVTGDDKAEQYDLYVRDDATSQIIFHTGFNPVQLPGEPPRDITKDHLKIALKLSRGGKFTLLLVGVIGEIDMGKPATNAKQLFWAGKITVDGTTNISARLLTVPGGDDQDRDLWPDAQAFLQHVPEASGLYKDHPDLLDCNDKMDVTLAGGSMVHASDINPFAVEICNDGVDENCNGNGDEPCVDGDGDGDYKQSDCDDKDPKRHHPNAMDPFPDPPNCCGYNLGKTGADANKSFLGDALLCPMKRCGDGIDEACRGVANDPKNDTVCVDDNDCDTYPAGTDCNDNDASVHPGAVEICGNTVDEDCDGKLDNGCVPCDLDGDTYQRNDPANGCPDMTNTHPGLFDCNDYDSGVFPGQTMSQGNKEGGVGAPAMQASALRGDCRRVYEPTGTTGTARVASFMQTAGDADCNGAAYEGCPTVACDVDGDGWPNAGAGCNPNNVVLDCNDADPTIYPGAPDKCGNGKAENCAQDLPCTNDKDGDGYAAGLGDCDDNNAAIHPWAEESCNGVDDDCDGLVDEGNPDPSGKPLVAAGKITTCTDDNDGECAKKLGTCVCSLAKENSHFDENNNRVFCPGENVAGTTKPPHCFGAGQPHPQTCDATAKPIDDDCDGRTDDPTGINLAVKGMPCGITVGQCKAGTIIGCDKSQTNCFTSFGRTPPATAWYVCSTMTVCPVTEVCNGLDDDCDGAPLGMTTPPAPGSVTTDELDHDNDKYLACTGCAGLPLAAGILGCGDCDDTAGMTHPGATETCDNIDNDCNPATADGKDQCGVTLPSLPNCCGVNGCRNNQTDFTYCGNCTTACTMTTANMCVNGGCKCGNNPACSAGENCTLGVCTKGNGGACNVGGDCTSGNCVDKVCCNTSACGSCQTCNGTTPGACSSVKNATDDTCIGASICDGGGVCKLIVGQGCTANVQCASGGCIDGVCCGSSTGCGTCETCNGSAPGTCTKITNAQDDTCTGNMICNGSSVCLKKNGQSCTSGGAASCASGVCADGFCCSGACGGQCQACNIAGSVGTCTPKTGAPVTGGTPPRSACGGVGMCQASCDGTNVNACATFPNGSTQCSAQSCAPGLPGMSQAIQTNAAACNGAGGCSAATFTNCTPYTTCNGTSCANTCANDNGCVSGFYCATTTCQAKLAIGTLCTASNQCLSGNCVNNGAGGKVCCAAGCTGTPTCSGDSIVPNTCGGGVCNTTPVTCGKYTCRAGACLGPTCAGDVDCAATAWCQKGTTNTCVDQLATGVCDDTTCVVPTSGCRMCAAGDHKCAAGMCPP